MNLNNNGYIVNYSRIRTAYKQFINMNGPYKYFVSVTLSKNYPETYLYSKMNFLLKVLSRNIFNSRKNVILLHGFCFVESSKYSSRCSKHFHFIIKNINKLNDLSHFEDMFIRSIDRVKTSVNGQYTQESEFDKNCICIKEIYDQEHLIDYLTDEFYKDKNGNFIKLIDKHGILI